MNSDKEDTTPKVTESYAQVSATATPVLSLSLAEQSQRHVQTMQTSRDAIPASTSSTSIIAMSSAMLSCGTYTMPPICTVVASYSGFESIVCHGGARPYSVSQNPIERVIYSVSNGPDRRGYPPPTLYPRTSVSGQPACGEQAVRTSDVQPPLNPQYQGYPYPPPSAFIDSSGNRQGSENFIDRMGQVYPQDHIYIGDRNPTRLPSTQSMPQLSYYGPSTTQ